MTKPSSFAGGILSAQILLKVASILSFSMAPWTVVIMLPINKRLLLLADSSKCDSEKEGSALENDFSRWVLLNDIRLTFGSLAWILALSSVIL